MAGGYENGPLSATLAFDQLNVNGNKDNDVKTFSLGASYDLGMVKPAFIYHSEKNGVRKFNNYMIGLTAPVGPGSVVGSYQRIDLKDSSNDSDIFAIGYVYNLSKRTAVYGTYAHANNKNGANRGLGGGSFTNNVTVGAGENVDGYQVGIRHAF